MESSTPEHEARTANLISFTADSLMATKEIDSGARTSGSDSSGFSEDRRVYSRQKLLSLQFCELASNPTAEDLLMPHFVNDGLFDPDKWGPHHVQTKSRSRADTPDGKASFAPDFFKQIKDTPDIAMPLRPQRKSFLSGCAMNADKGEKRKDDPIISERPHSSNEKRVGSGRLIPERAEKPDRHDRGERNDLRSERGAARKERRVLTTADRKDNWRNRGDDGGETEYRQEPRNNHRRLDQRGDQRNGHHRYEAEPEWLNEELTQGDTIELVGFDGHRGRSPEFSSKQKPESKSKAGAISKSKLPREEKAEPNDDQSRFDFDKFCIEMDSGALRDLGLDKSTSSLTSEQSSSKFCQYFRTKHSDQTQSSSDTETERLHSTGLEDDLSSIVKGLLSPGNDMLPSPQQHNSGLTPDGTQTSGSRLLNMLQASSQQPTHQSTPALPDVFSKLLVSEPKSSEKYRTTQPPLPGKYKTVEELEADLAATKAGPRPPIVDNRAIRPTGTRQPPAAALPPVTKPETALPNKPKDMTAYNKLVNMLQGTGELQKSVPKMPEITNRLTPTQLKQQSVSVRASDPDSPSHQFRKNTPTLQSVYASQTGLPPSAEQAFRSATPTGGLDIAVLVQIQAQQMHQIEQAKQLHKIHQQHLQRNLQTDSMQPPSMHHQNMQPQSMQPQTMQGQNIQAMNPLLQQTIQAQRQKLPSPIMFGAQPPVHIVAPAPIHPMSQNPQQWVSQPSRIPISQQNGTRQTASPMGQMQMSSTFTPTSVMRKLANDKVDMQQTSHHQNLKQTANTLPAANDLACNKPQLTVGQRLQHQQLQHQQLQHQQLQQQLLRNNISPANGGLPEQMLSRSSLEHPTLTLAHMVASQQQEHIWHQQSQGCAQPLSTQRQYDSGSLQSLQQQLAMMHAQPVSAPSPDNNISKWFHGGELQGNKLPTDASILTLEDIEH